MAKESGYLAITCLAQSSIWNYVWNQSSYSSYLVNGILLWSIYKMYHRNLRVMINLKYKKTQNGLFKTGILRVLSCSKKRMNMKHICDTIQGNWRENRDLRNHEKCSVCRVFSIFLAKGGVNRNNKHKQIIPSYFALWQSI